MKKRRPTEIISGTAGVASAIAFILAERLELSGGEAAALAVILGALPAAVTWLEEKGWLPGSRKGVV